MIVEWIIMLLQEIKVKENINYIDDIEVDLQFVLLLIIVFV